MYRVGRTEIAAAARVLRSGKLFRYDIGDVCARFETRYADYLGTKHCILSSSGTTALTAALVGRRRACCATRAISPC
jgi:dTDP-4-amino-4,6-dideoxygalactose transaminase